MKDSEKRTGVLYQTCFLLAVCIAAVIVIFLARYGMAASMDHARNIRLNNALSIVLDGVAYDNDPVSDKVEAEDASVVIYPAKKGPQIVAYAVAAKGKGFGGELDGLIGFDADGVIRQYVITSHHETHGIGSKVTDRVRKRKLIDILKGKPSKTSLPHNRVLDSFAGKSASGKKWTEKEIHFRAGATVSSKAVTELAWKAAEALEDYRKESGK